MTASAAVVSTQLIDLFDHVPEYQDYDCPDVVKELEADYRVAMGRVTKAWGDALLDLAERPRSPLTKQELRTIDALLDRITEIFDQLNTFEQTRLPAKATERRERLRVADGSILKTIEEAAQLIAALQPSRGVSLWLNENAAPMYRRLRRITKELRVRNRVLIGKQSLRGTHHEGSRS